MKDYLTFNDEDLAIFIKRHKGAIHTREFPTRCGTCRFIARFEAAENKANWTYHNDDDGTMSVCITPCKACDADKAWRKIAEKE